MTKRALKLAAVPALIALFITPARFFLELAGVPTIYVFLIGLLWLTLAFSIYWGFILSAEEHPYLLLLLSLLFFSPVSRIPVFVMWWITKTWELGTHYDIFDNGEQALIGTLVLGSLIQIIPGFLCGSLTLSIKRRKARSG